jgi:hypothetical protein
MKRRAFITLLGGAAQAQATWAKKYSGSLSGR